MVPCGTLLRVADTFVGRDRELAVLAGVRTRALEGRRQLVVVSGDAGIGKTSFCERASAAAERDGFDTVWGRCWPHGGAPALWPWPVVLPALTGSAGAHLLAGDRGGHGVDPERFARFAAVADLLASTRRQTPTMIVIDDAHRADESALLLTRFCANALDRLPLIIVLVRRNEDTALLDELARDATTIPLHRFGLHDAEALLAAHGQDRAVARTLLRLTGGSPLYLARAVSLGWTGSATVEHAISDALARLSSSERRILALAALLGVSGAVAEVAGLSGDSPAVVLDALTAASDAGLVDQDAGGWRLHELVRNSALRFLDAGQLLDAHARAATMLAGQPERVADHALAASARSTADAENAIGACRTAAASLRRGYAYEPAAALLDRAVMLTDHLPGSPARAELLVERAEALLACGKLIDARAGFEVATEAAEQARDPMLVARGVLGLGGVWVHEHRDATVRRRVLARQRAALRNLPARERSLRCRLAVRLAAEAVYEGKPVQNVLNALAHTRSAGDQRALAESLSLTHHAILGPEHAAIRLPMAEAQIAVASAAGDGILALFGLLWRTTDLYLLGDPDADRSLTELRQRAEALGVAAASYIVSCMDVMRLIRAGRLAEAEAAAGPCLQLGLEVGDADATGFFGAQLLTIRWLQGRLAELIDLVVATTESATLATVDYGFRASTALVLASGGRMTEARAALEPLLENGLAALPRSSTWMAAMVGIAEAARLLNDRVAASTVADLLRPYADLPVMASLAVSCMGSASRALGITALTVGDPAAAVVQLEHAVLANQRLGHRPAVAVSKAELAEALIRRGRAEDPARAKALLAEAAAEARTMDMPLRADEWTACAKSLDRPVAPAVLRRRDEGWTMQVGEVRITLPDLVGLTYLSRLLERPGQDVSAIDLCDGALVDDKQKLLDGPAVAAYRQRVRELGVAIDEAEADGNPSLAERLRLELDAVTAELTRSLGLSGRVRGFASPPERARTAVRKAIKRALDVIADADPVVGGEVCAGVTTGAVCRYTAHRRWKVIRQPEGCESPTP